MLRDQNIREFFAHTLRIAELCTQNGWPDPETIKVDVLERGEDFAVCSIKFEEVAMEASGCIAGRIECWGKYRLSLAPDGEIKTVQLLAGKPA